MHLISAHPNWGHYGCCLQIPADATGAVRKFDLGVGLGVGLVVGGWPGRVPAVRHTEGYPRVSGCKCVGDGDSSDVSVIGDSTLSF